MSLGSIISGGDGLEASEAALFTSAGWRKPNRSSSEWNSAEEVSSWIEPAPSTLGWHIANVGSLLLVAGDMSHVHTALVSAVVSFLQLCQHSWNLVAQDVLIAG